MVKTRRRRTSRRGSNSRRRVHHHTKRHSKRHSKRHHKMHMHHKKHKKHMHHKKHKRYSKKGGHRRRLTRLQTGGKYHPGEWSWGNWTPTWRTRNTFTPTPLVNLGRLALTGGENLINGWKGLPETVSPLATAQPDLLIDQEIIIPPDLTAINKKAQQDVMHASSEGSKTQPTVPTQT